MTIVTIDNHTFHFTKIEVLVIEGKIASSLNVYMS